MTTKKIDPLKTLKGEEGLEIRNAAIVYLHDLKEYSYQMLSDLTSLAVSTIRNYVKKFAGLLDWAKKIFTKGKNCIRKEVEKYYCYIDKVNLEDGRIWCKIGQTTTSPEQRAKQIKHDGWSQGKELPRLKPTSVEVQKVFVCKNATAMQNMEDCLRIGMNRLNPDKYNFIPNDRLDGWEDDFVERIINDDFVQHGLNNGFAIAV